MGKLVTLFILLNISIVVYPSEPFCEDSILERLITRKKTIINDNLNPGDSLYRVIGRIDYDLNGIPINQSKAILQIIIFHKNGKLSLYSSLNTSDLQSGFNDIHKRELQRIYKWVKMLNIPKLIEDRPPCISNELEFAGILSLYFVYDIIQSKNYR